MADMNDEVLIVSRSSFPIIRAGYGNIIFILLLISIILINQLLVELDVAPSIRMILPIFLLFLTIKIYSYYVSRIYIEKRKFLIIVRPFSISKFDVNEILGVELYGIPSSMTIFLKIKNKKDFAVYFFVAASTNFGSYNETKKKLNSRLAELICRQWKKGGQA